LSTQNAEGKTTFEHATFQHATIEQLATIGHATVQHFCNKEISCGIQAKDGKSHKHTKLEAFKRG